MTTYTPWSALYPNEAFDRTQRLAIKMTDDDRGAGRTAPAFGYSADNFKKAEQIVHEANMKPLTFGEWTLRPRLRKAAK